MKRNQNILLIIFLIILIITVMLKSTRIEGLKAYDKNELYEDMLENHYDKIFPDDANRNSAGFRFFKYIYDNLATSAELFDIYNQFYCAVSGSIVSPDRDGNYNIIKVKDLNGKCVYGKYYRCCTPCNCDVMKYAIVINTRIEMPKGSGKYIQRNLLTIGDPCKKIKENPLPEDVDKKVFKCSNGLLSLGYRVDKNNNLTMGEGRLVIGILYDLEGKSKSEVKNALSICTKGNKRIFSSPDKLEYGMGDIFVKLALINNNETYKNDLSDLCK